MSTIKNDVLRNISLSGLKFQTQLMLGLDTTPEPNEMLNTLWGVHADSTPGPNDRSFIQYFGIGRRGHRNVTIGDGADDLDLNQHYGSDVGLFQFIPFLVREISNDISTEERNQFGMRVPFEKEGINYVSYWLKVLDRTNIAVEMTQEVTTNGITDSQPFSFESSNLTPTPPVVNNSGNTPINNTTLFALANIPIRLTAAEISEIRNACEIFFGDVRYAYISEITLVRAAKRAVALLDSNFQPTGVSYNEAIQATCCFFITGSWPIRFMDELDFTVDGGGGIPLIGPTQTTTITNP